MEYSRPRAQKPFAPSAKKRKRAQKEGETENERERVRERHNLAIAIILIAKCLPLVPSPYDARIMESAAPIAKILKIAYIDEVVI